MSTDQQHCVFCKIVAAQLPSKEVLQNEYWMAFYDLYPKAKTHVLIVPKHHVSGMAALTSDDKPWLAEFFLGINQVAQHLDLDHYYVRIHQGAMSGQEIFHLHAHIMQD
jgi:histidine triad (HIT) family protein